MTSKQEGDDLQSRGMSSSATEADLLRITDREHVDQIEEQLDVGDPLRA